MVTDLTPSATYQRGANVSLNCSIVGGPEVTIQWLFKGVTISEQNSSVLYLSNVNASHGGSYTCMAFNSAGSFSDLTEIYISPYFIISPQSLDVSNGTVQSLMCEAEAFPTPEYQWVKSDGSIRSGVLGVNSTSLQFSPVVFGDAGSYYCNASSLGIDIQSGTIIVTGKYGVGMRLRLILLQYYT